MINYFNFKKIADSYLLTNDFGRYMYATKDEIKSLICDKVDYKSQFGKNAQEKLFCFDGSIQAFSEAVKPYLRESKSYLFSSTSLHIFVVTNSCNMKCVYCQAQSGECISDGMMSKEIAKKAVDIALSSPDKYLTFEFQGGEPLINFEIIEYIVQYTNSVKRDKIIDFNIVTNLTLLNTEMTDFIKKNNIGISTSLDGNKELHNKNRTYRNGNGTYDRVVKGMEKLKESEINFGAIETTTKYSIKNAKRIVDEYVDQGLDNLFIRPLTPLGCANKSWSEIGYSAEEFIDFYRECFHYIIEKNKSGIYLKEGHASMLLSKILEGRAINYMELRSPCGAGIGQVAYYYDGNIFTCDEGRMLSEMGDNSFKLGNVFENNYDDLISCNNCKAACISSVLESLPDCSDCVYNPYCGVCPVINYALYHDIIPKMPNNYRCKIYSGILDTIFEALKDSEKEKILKTWL